MGASDHEFGGVERREADQDVDDSEIVVLRGGLAVAFDEAGLARRAPLEGALSEEVPHEGAHVEADLRPQRLVVGLDHPLRSSEQALFDQQRESPRGHVLPL